MSNSNFCRNCGARLTRTRWRWWLRGALCDDCVKRPGVSNRGRNLIGIALVGLAAFAFGRYQRPTPPPFIIQRAANSPLSDVPFNFDGNPTNNTRPIATANAAEDDTVFICGARTKKGTPCRRRVQAAGERCFQHKERAAMVPLEKLVIKSDAAKK